MTRAVYVASLGCISPLGSRWPETAAALAQGQSAIAPIRHFDPSGFPCSVAAAIATTGREDDSAERGDLRVRLAEHAALEAWADAEAAGLAPVAKDRIGVFIGAESGRSTMGTVRALARAAGSATTVDHHAFGTRARPLAGALHPAVLSPAAVAHRIAGLIGAQGPVMTVSLACASGAAAIVEASRAIAAGLCDVALAGGVGADVDPLMLAGFGLLGALSSRGASCPFDVRRDGFVLGEGAAMAVLSARPHTPAPLAEVAGWGRTLDAYRLTAPEPEGHGAGSAIARALAMAGLRSVDYIQAHGTSTPLNDAAEALAIHRALGDSAGDTPVASVKGALGHWIAGAGALGFACAVWAVATGTMLATAGLESPDPALGLTLLAGRAIAGQVQAALCNSFAFGGANCSIVVRSCAAS